MESKFLDPSCPWAAYKFGKVLSCEERLCAWVRQPLNTYSSVVFLLAAAWLLWLWSRERRTSDGVYGASLVVIGLASALNHASQIKVFVSLDFSAIFVLVCALFTLGLRRRGWLSSAPLSWLLFVVLLGASAWLQYSYVRYGIPLVAFLAATVIALELFRSGPAPEGRGKLGLGLLVLALGAYCFYLDASGEWCEPSNHWFQLHALWHVACAAGLSLLAAYHRQFYRGNRA